MECFSEGSLQQVHLLGFIYCSQHSEEVSTIIYPVIHVKEQAGIRTCQNLLSWQLAGGAKVRRRARSGLDVLCTSS